jgi:hypothetical protein
MFIIDLPIELIEKICNNIHNKSIYDIIQTSSIFNLIKFTSNIQGIKRYYYCGKLHCINGPAVIGPDYTEWYQNDQLHRVGNGPSIEYANGDKQWYQNGKRHRLDGPAIESSFYNEWYQNDKLHRIDGPAIEDTIDNYKGWYQNGLLHRIDGPAIEEECFSFQHNRYVINKMWYQNGLLHRIGDRPAVIDYVKGIQEWWLNGQYQYTSVI